MSCWLSSVDRIFSIEDAGPGFLPCAIAEMVRYSSTSSTSVRMRTSARRAAKAGSSMSAPPSGPGWPAADCASSCAMTCSIGAAAPPRSCTSRYLATVQPSSIVPSTLLLGTRTLSKKTWFCTSSPEVITSGRISMPGLVMSMSRKVMPSCFLPVRAVRTRQKIQLASVAWVVQILLPVQRKSSPSSTAAIDSEARSEPASGSE
ncbi:Uncharacterised protein [Mycobacteroides abscessus subsp. abscessus]|nr:Uncharacterised protein [Mycobacteroides abscessus subsp. abscessus]